MLLLGVCVYAGRGTYEHTFFNDAPLVIQHTLHLAASHVHQASLLHKGLAPVEACAVGQVGPHRDQKANVMLPQPYRKRECRDGLDRERQRKRKERRKRETRKER